MPLTNLQPSASENLQLEGSTTGYLVVPGGNGGLGQPEGFGNRFLATEVPDNVFLAHARTKTDLSLARKHVLAETDYSLDMIETTRGQRIKEARLYWQSQGRDRTVKALVGLLGVTEPTYYNWEGDKVDDILASNLMKLSKVTGFHPNYLANNRRPKMLSEDAALARLLDIIEDFTQSEFDAVINHAMLIRNARPIANQG